MAYGVTDAGFVQKTISVSKTELESAFQSIFGAGIDLTPSSVFGQLIGIMAEREAEIWEMAGKVYDAFTPDGASGSALDNLSALTGTFRLPATKSTVTLTCTGTTGTTLAAGRTVSVTGTGVKFSTLESATIAAATAWQTSHAYIIGDRVKNGSKIYLCTSAGSSASSGGPTGTGSSITDGTVGWKYLGDGVGYVDVDAAATVSGPVPGVADTLTTIETPVGGWNNVRNLHDAKLGNNVETDAELRLRRLESLQQASNATNIAIRDAILSLPTVFSCTVFENDTDDTVNDIPPHSINCLVQYTGSQNDETDAAILKTILDTKAAGINTTGGVTGNVTDSQGLSHSIAFSRPNEINIYALVAVTVDASTYPSDGDTQIKAAIANFGASFKTGQDAVTSRLAAECFNISGVLDASVYIGTDPDDLSLSTIVAEPVDLLRFDTSRINVTSTEGSP